MSQQPIVTVSEDSKRRILDALNVMYDPQRAEACMGRVFELISRLEPRPARYTPAERLTERDVVLITYGDLLRRPGQAPLGTLYHALMTYLKGVIGAVHILPFFPYSSDDGFAVIDYLEVNPEQGSWEDIHRIGREFRLMIDAVVNHISSQSRWFQAFLAGDPAYRDFFIVVDPDTDLSGVTRPRTTPLLTKVMTKSGEKYVWTTFSADQIDLNYANENVLLAMLDVILEYVRHGAEIIRLDAIAYLWKEIGTSCIHLPGAHAFVRLLRAILDIVAPDVLIITETNVPHEENVSYFGNGTDEAQLVYQFSLPPLIVHTFLVENTRALSDWASTLRKVSDMTTFLNFTASHDGIGVRPATGLLSDDEIQALVEMTLQRGGHVSYKTNSDGTKSPYELNITYFDAISDPYAGEDAEVQVSRFLASQAIMLAFAGVPAIYFHSLLGSRNWTEGVKITGRARTINRQKLDYLSLRSELQDPNSIRHRVFTRYRHMILKRIEHRAFHPNGPQQVLYLNESVFSLLRTSPEGDEHIIALHNVSGRPQKVALDGRAAAINGVHGLHDILSGRDFPWPVELRLAPYQVAWLLCK